MSAVLAPPSTAPPPAAAPPQRRRPADPDVEPPHATSRTGVRMTAEEFLTLPPDPAYDRWLIGGELWEKPVTIRNRFHTAAEFNVVVELGAWLKTQPEPRPRGASGEAGVLLPGRTTALGVDAAVFDAATVAAQPPRVRGRTTLWEGVPLLAAEVISPSDEDEEIGEKVLEYLEAGVGQVWLIRPLLRTVTVHRAGDVASYAGDDVIPGDPELPGLAVRAGDLFGG